MIRRVFESWYDRTIGAARNSGNRMASYFTKRGNLLQVLYVVLLVGFTAGFIDAVFFPVSSQSYVIWPGTGEQTVAEAFIDFFVVAVGGGGIYLAYLSGRQTTSPRMVNFYLALSLLLVAVSLLAGIEIAIIKGYG